MLQVFFESIKYKVKNEECKFIVEEEDDSQFLIYEVEVLLMR